MGGRTVIGVVAAVATMVLYGSSFVFTKGAVELLTPAALLAWRFVVALAGLGVLLATRVIRLTLTRRSVRPLLALALFQPLLYYSAETLGVQRATASESGILIATIPVGVLLASWLVLGRPPSRRQVVGILITFAGVVATVVTGGISAGLNPFGYLFLLAAVASYSVYAAFAERDTTTSALDKTFAMIAVGAVIFSAIAIGEAATQGRLAELLVLPATHPQLIVSIGYLAIGASIAAFFCQIVAISHLGSNRYSTYIGLSTLVSLIAAAAVLGERLAPLQFVGAGVILLGVYVANAAPRTPDDDSAGLRPSG